MSETLATEIYTGKQDQSVWHGYIFFDNQIFDSFIKEEVASRLNDEEGTSEFELQLQSLSLTDFGTESLRAILDAEIPEERDWAVGESIAEAWLDREHGVIWPWNAERDKKNPKSSLPGADLVGFIQNDAGPILVLGEVKSSTEKEYPPQVMSGRDGHMGHQIDDLANNLTTICSLLKWLCSRCKNTEFEDLFKESSKRYFNSGNKAVSLFGVLIRDTKPNELDLKGRGIALGNSISHPTSCNLIALHLPCKISELPEKVRGGKKS